MSLTVKVITALGLATLIISGVLFYWGWSIFQLSGQPILDTQFTGRTTESVSRILSAYQGTGSLEIYKKIQHLDMVYPLVYGAFGVIWLYHLFKPTIWRFSCILPFISAMFDFLENNLLAQIVSEYPAINDDVVMMSSLYTQFKYALILLALAALVFGLMRRRTQTTRPV